MRAQGFPHLRTFTTGPQSRPRGLHQLFIYRFLWNPGYVPLTFGSRGSVCVPVISTCACVVSVSRPFPGV